MTHSSQLPAQLAEALQQLSQLPQDPVKYCQDLGDPNDINSFKACISIQGRLRNSFDQLIPQLRRDIAFSNLLLGTWTITTTVRDNSGNIIVLPDYSGLLRIDSWDTGTGVLGGRIDIPKQSSDFPGAPNYIQAIFRADTLKLDITLPIVDNGLVYD